MAAHMTPDEFREHGHQVVDWIADYWSTVESRPVRSQVSPGDTLAALPAHPPEVGEPFEAVLADVERIVLPGVTHWQHPKFFAYFPANSSGPAVLGDLLSSGLGVQGMLWATSPACTEMEQVVMDWMVDLLGLPDRFRNTGAGGGVIEDTASTAVLVALVAALHRATKGRAREVGLSGQAYAVYASSQVHSALQKAAMIAGVGADAVRLIDVDPVTQALRPDLLRAAVQRDVAAGVLPVMAVAAVGTTSTTAFDPVPAMADICTEFGIWLHVDAAFAGVAAVCPELRWVNDGFERIDSVATNPHKWLLTTFDCTAFWVADRAMLIEALSILPEFLRNTATDSGAVVDYRDWQIQLGRRFRALKLWSVIRWYGAEGLREHIRGHVALAQEFAGWVEADPRFAVMAPHPLSLVCFRQTHDAAGNPLADPDAATLDLMERLNDGGDLYLTHTKINDQVSLRLAIGAVSTRREHVEAAWESIRAAAM